MIQNVNDRIAEAFSELSNLLLLPVLLVVIGLLVVKLLILGGLLREALDRRRTRSALRAAIAQAQSSHRSADQPEVLLDELMQAPSGIVRQFAVFASVYAARNVDWDRALRDVDGAIAVALGRLGFLSRLGPMLGLLGTLIPFGPALAGLSSGDVHVLSSNLVTAFATTVVGLLCGSVAMAVGSVRRTWYTRDLNDLEYLVQLLTEKGDHETPHLPEVAGNGRRPDLRTRQPV